MSKLQQKYWTFGLDEEGTTSVLDSSDRKKWPPVMALIDELFNARTRCQKGVPKIMDELECTMRAEPSQENLITPTVANRLSDLAAYGEIENSLWRHRPQILPRQDIKADNSAQNTINLLIERVEQMFCSGDYASPLAGFACPYHRHPNRQNIESMCAADAKLDAFWAHVDAGFFKSTKPGVVPRGPRGFMANPRTVQRTPPWQDPDYSTVKYESFLLQRNSLQRLNVTTIFLSDRGYNTRRVRADPQGEEEGNRHRRPNKRGHHFRASIPLAADRPLDEEG